MALGRPPIKFLTQALIALLLATLVVVAGTMLVLSGCQSKQTEFPTHTPIKFPQDTIPTLAPRLRDRPQAKNASGIRRPVARGAIQVRVEGARNEGEPVVIAVFDAAGVRLAKTQVDRAPFETTFPNLPAGELQVCLGRCLECIRLSYFRQERIQVRAGVPTRRTYQIATRPLRIALAATAKPGPRDHRPSIAGIPVLLHRVGDPTWRYRRPFSKKAEESIVRTDANGVVTFQDLGPGSYRVEMQGFDVLQADRQRLTFALPEFDQSRPLRGLPQ